MPRSTLVLVLLPVLSACSSDSVDLGWGRDFDAALQESRRTGRPVLADFTGSDWCGWCQRLSAEVFQTSEFRDWADENVVLLELDFPRAGNQDPAEKRRNAELAERYGVRGFPTIVFLDAEGEKLGELGYVRGGPGPWLERARAVLGR